MQPAWPQAPPPPARRSIWIWLGPLLLVVLAAICLTTFIVTMRFCGQMKDAAGVLAANEISPSTMDKITDKGLLLPSEKIVCYYDASISGDMSEVSLLTTERLVYLKDDRTTAFDLGKIADVRHHNESLVGDVIEAQTDSGELMTFSIAPMNDGPKFVSALQTAWKKKRGSR